MSTTDYPPPLIIPPRVLPHKQTFILLHGRGSSGEKFGPVLLDTPLSQPADNNSNGSPASNNPPAQTSHTTQTLATTFPHARFIFPTAPRRRATLYRHARTRQWFDSWEVNTPDAAVEREELQGPGLRETTAYLHGLLAAEIARVPGGAANVVLGGLSQGCAESLVAVLLWEGSPLGAVVGMCGWLPFAGGLVEEAGAGVDDGREVGEEEEEENDLFEREDDFFDREEDGGEEKDPVARARHWLRGELELPGGDARDDSSAFQEVPVFLGHGVEDDRVSVVLGRNAAACFGTLGVQTLCWKEYRDLAHWYSGDMLRDIVAFLRNLELSR